MACGSMFRSGGPNNPMPSAAPTAMKAAKPRHAAARPMADVGGPLEIGRDLSDTFP